MYPQFPPKWRYSGRMKKTTWNGASNYSLLYLPRLGLISIIGLPFAATAISSKNSTSIPPMTERERERKRKVRNDVDAIRRRAKARVRISEQSIQSSIYYNHELVLVPF